MSGMSDFNSAAAARKRDAKLRWRLLDALHRQRGNQHGGWCTARWLIDIAGGFGGAMGGGFASDEHALGLLRDLVNKSFAREEDNREDRSQPFGPDYLTFAITGNGSAYCTRALPPDPDIDDGRIVRKPRPQSPSGNLHL